MLSRGEALAYALLVLLGATFPLTDTDLPLHLRIGEWIVRQRAWPTVEPLAWTRAGEPYFAYSWLPQVTYYGVQHIAGIAGLRVLNGLMFAGAAAAMMAMARSAGWTRPATLIMVAMHVAALAIAVPSLRPQGVLFLTLPLVWAAVLRLLTQPDCRKALALLFLGSTVSAASHIFFPLTAVPVAALVVAQSPSRTIAKASSAMAGGWLLSPYALRWPEVFALNFAPNVLLARGSPIEELRAGFSLANGPTLPLVFVLVISVAIAGGLWILPFSRRARVIGFGLLIAGVTGFAYASRLILLFWLLCAPVAGHLLSVVIERKHGRAVARGVAIAALLLIIASVVRPRHIRAWMEDGVLSEALVARTDTRLRPTVHQFGCIPDLPAVARVYTRMAYANILAWRLRPHSMSIDSRTIFPDSIATGELDPGGSAQVAVVSQAHIAILHPEDALAPRLQASPDWQPLPSASGSAADLVYGDRRLEMRSAHDREPPMIWLNVARHSFGPASGIDACAASY